MTPKQISTVQDSWAKVHENAKQLALNTFVSRVKQDESLDWLAKYLALHAEDETSEPTGLLNRFEHLISDLANPSELNVIVKKIAAVHQIHGFDQQVYDSIKELVFTGIETALNKPLSVAAKKAWSAVTKSVYKAVEQVCEVQSQKTVKQKTVKIVQKEATMDSSNKASNDLAVRLQGALDQSSTAFMMIDRDFIVTYVNEATMQLLTKHEQAFQQKWPSFVADKAKVIGSCIDVFHVKPEHQRALLADPSNLPWKTDIQVAHLTIELNVTAINNAEGEYIGNSLEWQDVTEARTKALEVGRLMSAVEGMTTNLMMADLQGNIVYANPSVIKMLARREDDLRKVFPSFSTKDIVGTNFDIFHKNPAHQQNLLGDMNNMPYTTEITVAGLVFELIAIALKDEQGNHVGNAVQWLDLTEQKDAQDQVEGLINSAIQGKLDTRIETEKYQGFMRKLGDSINGLMDTIIQPISEARDVAQALARGNLTQSMDGSYDGEFLALAEAMNESIRNLSNMVNEIRSASTNVFDSARELAEGNNELSHRTESQASSLEQTASAMEQLTSTVQQNAENTSNASKLSASVVEKAKSGGAVVSNAITAMTDINKSSKKIADIISVIDEIAFQTNLLALNAAVEAARAGEQGRGFAVVAAEVRNLAQRSAGAAKEIKGLINDSVEAVGLGTKLVDETGQTFDQLVSAIEEVGTMLADIDSAGKEQSAGIGEVSAAVSQMDEMTQQNAALVEEAASASKSMEEQSQGLLDQVAYFDNGGQEPAVETAVVRKVAREPQLRAPKPVRQARAQTLADDEWEEF